jgi:hypothetical protein
MKIQYKAPYWASLVFSPPLLFFILRFNLHLNETATLETR